MKPSFVIPFPVLYRGFSPEESRQSEYTPSEVITLIVKHKRTRGVWVYGYYFYSKETDQHWILTEDQTKMEVLPQTVGLLEPTSGRYCGDVCIHNDSNTVGIVRFGKHRSQDGLNREEISFYIDWQGNTLSAKMLRQDLLRWACHNKDVFWTGTMWEPKGSSNYKEANSL